jgi:phosphinothricin acetyltransferase
MSERGGGVAIRPGQIADLPQLVEIFNFYIANGHATFGTELHTEDTRRPWFDSYGHGRYRLFVAASGDDVVGYATSSRYRPGAAFDFTVETSVYLHPDKRRAGLGSSLYSALFEALKSEPAHLALAGIACPNPASVALHQKFGFEEVGTFKEYARKNGMWISSTWFQKRLATA